MRRPRMGSGMVLITCERCAKVYDKGYKMASTTRYEARFEGWEYKDGKDTCLRCTLLKREEDKHEN